MNENEVKLLIEVDQRSKFNSDQLQEVRQEIKEFQKGQNAIYELACSIKQIAEDVVEVKNSQKEFVVEVKQNQKELNATMTAVQNRVLDVENKPANETVETINKIKVSVLVATATFLATGILGSLIMFAIK